MNNLLTLYKLEIKKILSKRAVWIGIVTGLAFIFMVSLTNLSSDGHLSYIKSQRDILGELSGQKIDDEFISKFQKEIIKNYEENKETYETIMNFDPGAVTTNVANAIGKYDLFNFFYNVVRNREKVMTINQEEFYNLMRENIIKDGNSLGTSNEEINEWLKIYDSIEKPIEYEYALAYSNIINVLFLVGWVLFINITIALSGMFADEKQFKTDVLIFSSKKGRSTLVYAKLLAGITTAVLQTIILFGGLCGLLLYFYGIEGYQGVIQNVIPSSPYNITIAQMMGVLVLLMLITSVLFATTNMLLSLLTRSSVATLSIQTAVLFLSLFNIPKTMATVNKFWQLRPTMICHYGTFCNTFRYGPLNNIQVALISYILLIIICIIVTIRFHKKEQVESR